MKIKIFGSLLVAFIFSFSSYGQNYKFTVNNETKTISTSESLDINPTSSSFISLTGGGIITFDLYTKDDLLLMLAEALDIPNKLYDLPIEVELSNGTIIKWKNPSLNYIKLYDYKGGNIAKAFGLTPSCSFKIYLSCLHAELGGNTIEERKTIFQNLLKKNDIKRIIINLGDENIIPINFQDIKTSSIISKMLTM